MSVALRKPMTLPQFLAWEEQQELRYEFDGFQPVAMTGGTDTHEAIGGTLRSLLQAHLRGKPCRVRGPTMKIDVMDRVSVLNSGDQIGSGISGPRAAVTCMGVV